MSMRTRQKTVPRQTTASGAGNSASSLEKNLILVIDGHDSAGKTTLSRRLARDMKADYLRPFGGEKGTAMLEAAESGKFREAARLAHEMVDRVLSQSSSSIKVLDRHWMTVLTLLPEALWNQWLPPPPTFLCWVDIDVTLARIHARWERHYPRSWHLKYIHRYLDLAKRFEVPILRTDNTSVSDASAQLHLWALTHLKDQP